MHRNSQIIRFRNQRTAKEKKHPWLKLGVLSALLLSMAVVLLSIVGVLLAVTITRDLPSSQILPALLDPVDGLLNHPTRLMDRSGEHVLFALEKPQAAQKRYVFISPDGHPGMDQVPSYLVDATILESDPDFWSNPGYKVEGIEEGTHPTLAQTLVDELVLDDEPASTLRNIRERILAAQLTSDYGRKKVLEWYLNSAQYGDAIFGVDAASNVYFGKPAAKLSFAEAAMLVAVSENPSIDPVGGSKMLKQKQELIIQTMLVKGQVTGFEAEQALNEELIFKPETNPHSIAPTFTALVLDQLSSIIPMERLNRGGYEIITTLDYDLQAQAECAVSTETALLEGRQVPEAAFDGSDCKAAGFLQAVPGDAVQQTGNQNTQVVIIDPLTGQVLALTGDGPTEKAITYSSQHPTATILNPLLALTAFTRGMSPASLLWDLPTDSKKTNADADTSRQPGENSTTYHGPVSLRRALANDYPGAITSVFQQVGGGNVLETEQEFGIYTGQSDQQPEISYTNFISQETTLLNVVQAYAVLANNGKLAGQDVRQHREIEQPPRLGASSILIARDFEGHVQIDWTVPKVIPVTSPQLAFLVTDVLSDEKARRQSMVHPNWLDVGQPAAAKASMTSDEYSAWAVGYIPQLAVGVWVNSPLDSERTDTASISAGLWQAVMRFAASQVPVQEFSLPTGVKHIQVCDPSGMLPSPRCPDIVQEVFLVGNEPTEVDDLYKKYLIDRETGLLATIFTPTDLIENKVMLNIPPQAKEWARSAGLTVPPDTYDSISLPPQITPDIKISKPLMFDHVNGEVILTGSAGGQGFSYYRLEVGKGLNPERWIQIGDDVDQPVTDGVLGSWDTSGMQGLYVLKLLVVEQDKSYNEALLQVTVDKTSPEIEITSPGDGAIFSLGSDKTIMMAAEASDDLVVDRVEFYMDGEMVASVIEPPYAILWNSKEGKHTLSVKAFDLAGNQTDTSVGFIVNR